MIALALCLPVILAFPAIAQTWQKVTIGTSGGSMVYPGSGIAYSTGSAWGTSYTTSGSGTVLALTASPTLTGTVAGANSTWIGSVGIGSTSPVNTLDVNGTGVHIGSGVPSATTYQLYNNGGALTWNGTALSTSGMTYPGSGIPQSTGSAWGTSYTTLGSGTVLALATLPTITTPTFSGTVTNGTFSGGTWNGTVIGATYGGTGVNNGSNTITLGGSVSTAGAFTTSGAYSLTLTTSGTTSLTLPTSGTVTALGNTTTGSGSIVLATSPTITTPTIATSMTGPILYGGTGASSTLTLSGTSNGSPSNAYVLLNPSGGGNVGIGSSAPVNTLDVVGSGLHIGSGVPGATAYQLYNSSGTLYWNGSALSTSGMTYPGSGIPQSTGSAWGTSYTTLGSGTVLALATLPTITTPTFSGTVTNGTFSGGTWNGTVIGATYGGTGVNNGSNTITLGGSVSTAGAFTTSGAYSLTLTTTGATNVTLPTSGTLVNTGITTLSSLASIGTITTGTWNGTVITGQYGGTGVANTGKTLTLGGSVTYSGANSVTWTTSGTTSLTLPTGGTVTALGNTTTGSGSIVLATSPTISGATLSNTPAFSQAYTEAVGTLTCGGMPAISATTTNLYVVSGCGTATAANVTASIPANSVWTVSFFVNETAAVAFDVDANTATTYVYWDKNSTGGTGGTGYSGFTLTANHPTVFTCMFVNSSASSAVAGTSSVPGYCGVAEQY